MIKHRDAVAAARIAALCLAGLTLGAVPSAAEARLQAEGVVELRQGDGADLDLGRETTGGAADIRFTQDEAGRPVLAPLEDVLIGLQGDSRPGPRDCFAARFSPAPVRMHRLRPARYLCVRTNQGRFSALRVLSTPSGRAPDANSLTLELRTFAPRYPLK